MLLSPPPSLAALVFLALAASSWLGVCGQECGDLCFENGMINSSLVYPNKCGPGTLLTMSSNCPLSAQNRRCCLASYCCRPTSNCQATSSLNSLTGVTTVSTSSCCKTQMSRCTFPLRTQVMTYLSRRQLNGTFAPSCRLSLSTTAISCGPNYLARRLRDSHNDNLDDEKVGSTSISRVGDTNFCVPANCQTAAAQDCTQCLACQSGFLFISDGSCQLPPTLSITLRRQGVSFSASVGTAATLDPGQGVLLVSVSSILATARGSQSWTGIANTINSTQCALNALDPIAINASTVFSVPVGLNNLKCWTTDFNGLFTIINSHINVTDTERPRITCLNILQSASTVNLSSLALATDNVLVVRNNCSGSAQFAMGTTSSVACTAVDSSGLTATCTATVRITDTEPPQVTCGNPSPLLLMTAAPGTDTSPLLAYALSATDNVGVVSTVCSVPLGALLPLGSTTIACSAADAAGLLANCSYSVTVVDAEPPAIVCPPALLLGSGSGSGLTSALVNLSATDNAALSRVACSFGALTIINQTSNFISFSNRVSVPVGSTVLTCTAYDVSNNNRSCSTTLTVTDTSPPSIACPLPQALSTDPDRNFTTVNFSTNLVATDNVAVASTSCTPPGSLAGTFQYPTGTTVVTCTATDTSGLSSTCSFTVVVGDTQPPSVQCPLTSVRLNTSTTANITVPLPLLNASDNVRVNYTRLTITENGWPNTTRQLPPTATSVVISRQWSALVTFQAVDMAGLSVSCTFGISVFAITAPVDNAPPVILNCPTPFLFSTSPNSNFDSYNSSVYIYNLTTIPNENFQTLVFPNLNATDNVRVATQTYLSWSTTPAQATTGLVVGRYVAAYVALDDRGNSAYCVFRIQVRDVQPPTWTNCPNGQVFTYATGSGSTSAAPVNWPAGGMVASDNYEIANPHGVCTSVPAGFCPPSGTAPAALGVGNYSFFYSARDTVGNGPTNCSFRVVVADTARPSFPQCTSPSVRSVTTSIGPGENFANISAFCQQFFAATDNIGVTSLAVSSTPPGFGCTQPLPLTGGSGPITLTATARDAAGNAAECTLILTVRDEQPPVLSGCVANRTSVITAVCDANAATAVVAFPAVSATDNSGAATLSAAVQPPGSPTASGSAFPLGTTVINFTARDSAGNEARCTLQIVVTDAQPPTLTGFPPGSVDNSFAATIGTDAGLATATYTLPSIAAVDNVGLRSSGFVPGTYVAGGTYAFPLGTTTLVYNATDTSGLWTAGTVRITVEDRERPRFTHCPTLVAANTTPGDSTAQVSWPPVGATDNVDGGGVTTVISSVPGGFGPGGFFPIGTTTITYTAIDSAGNEQTCEFEVRVADRERPLLVCPDNFTIPTLSMQIPVADVAWREPVVTDNSNAVMDVNSTARPGNFSTGSHVVRYWAIDGSGNVGTCMFGFRVLPSSCSLGCETCTTPSPTDCQSCLQHFYLYNSQCVVGCPVNMYINAQSVCTACSARPVCNSTTYVKPCDDFSDTACVACTVCPAGEVALVPCSSNADAICGVAPVQPTQAGPAPAAASSSSDASTLPIVAGAAGGALLFVLLAIALLLVIVKTRKPGSQLQPSSSSALPANGRGEPATTHYSSLFNATDVGSAWFARNPSFTQNPSHTAYDRVGPEATGEGLYNRLGETHAHGPATGNVRNGYDNQLPASNDELLYTTTPTFLGDYDSFCPRTTVDGALYFDQVETIPQPNDGGYLDTDPTALEPAP